MLNRIFILLLLMLSRIEGCSRIFWEGLCVRSMDLYLDDKPAFLLQMRGVEKEGGPFPNPARWQSKWGSVVVTAFQENVYSEGMNEKGLSAHLLYLHETQYEKRDNRPGLSNSRWVEYILDNFATVDEVVKSLDQFQVISNEVIGQLWPLHLCIEDPSGDSAIIEYLRGKMHVHHGPEYRVMTNEPSYAIQLKNLPRYRYFGGKLPLPGDVDSMSRFVRCSAFLKTLPRPTSRPDAIGWLFGAIRTVQVPFGAQDTSDHEVVVSWPTRWLSMVDVKERVYYFNSTSTPNIVWVDFSKIDFSKQKQMTPLPLHDNMLIGDISFKL